MKILIAVLFVLLFNSISYAEDFVVIVNAANSEQEAKGHFLLLEEMWDNGAKTAPFEVDSTGDATKQKAKNAFLKQVLNMNSIQYKQHWVDQKAAGKTTRPAVVKGYTAVKRFVMRKKGGIGYIPKVLADAKVKIIKTFSVN